VMDKVGENARRAATRRGSGAQLQACGGGTEQAIWHVANSTAAPRCLWIMSGELRLPARDAGLPAIHGAVARMALPMSFLAASRLIGRRPGRPGVGEVGARVLEPDEHLFAQLRR
jgi:hypothetical protein